MRSAAHGIEVRCNKIGCFHRVKISFDALGLPDDTDFLQLTRSRRFRCSKCDTVAKEILADWIDPSRLHGHPT